MMCRCSPRGCAPNGRAPSHPNGNPPVFRELPCAYPSWQLCKDESIYSRMGCRYRRARLLTGELSAHHASGVVPLGFVRRLMEGFSSSTALPTGLITARHTAETARPPITTPAKTTPRPPSSPRTSFPHSVGVNAQHHRSRCFAGRVS